MSYIPGVIRNDESYSHIEIGRRYNLAPNTIKTIVYDRNISYTELVQGLLIIQGVHWNTALSMAAEFDTAEKKEERRRKSGAASRAKKPKAGDAADKT